MRVVRRDDITRPVRAPSGERVYEMIGRPPERGGTTKHSFVHVVIPPGGSSLAHYHEESEETYYVLDGEGDLVVDDETHHVTPATAYLIMPGKVHQIFATGDRDLQFLAVSAPAWVASDSYPAESRADAQIDDR